jgi:adenosylcobinamide kinase/adenosylcobinamide-phosphate guanylyltransferase
VSFPRLTLVLGGAASGKSNFAETLATQSALPRSYIATAQAFDDEMRLKIIKHQTDRGDNWLTSEAPLNLCETLATQPKNNIILVDCLTLWLSNLLIAEKDISTCGENLLTAVTQFGGPVVCVTNEVGLGLVPDTALGRKFREAQGRLNQEIAKNADLVVLVTAGIPQAIKGTLP